MAEEDCILKAYNLSGNGFGQSLASDAVSAQLEVENMPTWVHLDALHPDCASWLEDKVSNLDSLLINALLADETRPRIVEFETGVLLILRGVNLNDASEPEDMVSIRLWVDSYRIISLQRRSLKATEDICQKLDKGSGPEDPGAFVAQLSALLVQRMESFFTGLDERLDDVEERIIEAPHVNERQSIISIRKQAIIVRRYIAPQRDAIARLVSMDRAWLSVLHRRRLQESMDHIVRYIEDLDEIRERAQVVKDELVNALSDRMNRNLYVLSVITAIFLPLGFLTGLLGVNLGGIPGAENSAAFYLFALLLMVIILLQVVILRKFKWF